MAIKRKKGRVTSRRRGIVNLRRYFGGYMESGNWTPQPTDKRYREGMKAEFEMKNRGRKLSKWDAINWYSLADKVANRNVIDAPVMNDILTKYRSGTEEEKKSAMELLRDHLVIRDIQKNPEDYLKEYEKGKHRKNNWAKWAGGAAEVVALIASAYGAYKFGPAAVVKMKGLLSGLGAEGGKKMVEEGGKKMAEEGGKKTVSYVTGPVYKGVSELLQNKNVKNQVIAEANKGHLTKMAANAALDSSMIDLSGYKEGDRSYVGKLFDSLLRNITTEGNNGFLGKRGEEFVVNGPGGIMSLDKTNFWKHVMKHPDDFKEIMENFDEFLNATNEYKISPEVVKDVLQDHGILYWLNPFNWGSGGRFRVTHKGRRLIKRYRRHLRHKIRRRKH